MKEIITAQEAARILLINGQAVREHIKRGIPPFNKVGYVISNKGRKNQYLVYTRKLLDDFGIDIDTAEARLKKGKHE